MHKILNILLIQIIKSMLKARHRVCIALVKHHLLVTSSLIIVSTCVLDIWKEYNYAKTIIVYTMKCLPLLILPAITPVLCLNMVKSIPITLDNNLKCILSNNYFTSKAISCFILYKKLTGSVVSSVVAS